MTGHYTSHYLAEILRDLYFEESTGAIEIKSPDGRFSRLHFDRGMLYFAETGEPEDQLESCLEAAGLLPISTLNKLRKLTAPPIETAARLVSTGVLPAETLVPVIRALVQRAVVRAFSWPSGSCQFTAQEATLGVFQSDILFTFESILRGIAGMAHFGPLKEALLHLDSRVKLSERVFLPVQLLALKPHHGFILSRIDGTMRLHEIAMVLPSGDEDESLQFLYGLAVLGIIEFVPPINEGLFSLREIMQGHHEAAAREKLEAAFIEEAVNRVMSQGPAEILGIAMDSELPRIQHAFDQLKGKFKRERFCERTREKYKKELALIDSKLGESFLRLRVERLELAVKSVSSEAAMSEIDPTNMVVRREMVKSEAQATQEQNSRLADMYFQKAREYFNEKDYHNCIQFCRLSIKFQFESATVYSLMGEALSKNPNTRWQKMAEEALTKACELDPWNAEHHVSLGIFYRNQGMELRARRQFEKALEILPSHPLAKSELKACSR